MGSVGDLGAYLRVPRRHRRDWGIIEPYSDRRRVLRQSLKRKAHALSESSMPDAQR